MKEQLYDLALNLRTVANLMECNQISTNRAISKLRQSAEDATKMYYALLNSEIAKKRTEDTVQ